MKLIFIYGPPAVGKLSVAKELSKITGYRVFHNHASVDFVGSIFEFGTPAFSRLVVKYRMEMLEEAAKASINTIFTSAYIRGYKERITRELVHSIEKHGGEVCFVRLYCDRKELIRRVMGKSRQSHGKIKTRKDLAAFLKRYDISSAPESHLSIDNTGLSPKRVAVLIAKHYGL